MSPPKPKGTPKRKAKPGGGQFGKRVAEKETVPKRYYVPRYVISSIKEIAPPYGSQGRMIQVGAEIMSRMQYHPIPVNPNLKRNKEGAEELVGMTYKLLPRTIEIIEKYASQYKNRAAVFEVIVTLLSRKFIA
jgi:hypothetical protein